MRRRLVCVLVAVLLAAALASCGGNDEETTSGSLTLTVYTGTPLEGKASSEAQDVVDAVKLALHEADGRVGPFGVNLVSLDDANADSGRWNPEEVVTNARRAISDQNTIAYIGDMDSAATALSLPLLNEAGVLQVSPTASYVGLTRPSGRGEPERFYPAGERTFGRLVPADDVQAAALLALMRADGVRRLAVVDDGELFGMGLAQQVVTRARRAGIRVVTQQHADPRENDRRDVARAVAESGADAALFAGTTDTGAAAVLDAIEDAAPNLGLYGPAGLANGAFAKSVNPDVARRLQITSPALPTRLLPPDAARFARAFRDEYGHDADPAALFGYEAMRAVLAAMRAAGTKGNDREAVIHAYFGLRDRRTALGTWSVTPTGDTTLRRFGAWRVSDGRLAFERELPAGGS